MIHISKILPSVACRAGKALRDGTVRNRVTPLRRAGFPLLPRATACHDELLVSAPVDAHAVEGCLGCCTYPDLGGADDR